MLKAVAITKFESAFGQLTVAVTEENEIMFRANEVAKLFGYSDRKGCVRQYAEEAKLVVMPTAGGDQPVKCISWRDVMHIGFKSRMSGKEDLLFELSYFHKCVKIEILELENTHLKAVIAEAKENTKQFFADLEHLKDDMDKHRK